MNDVPPGTLRAELGVTLARAATLALVAWTVAVTTRVRPVSFVILTDPAPRAPLALTTMLDLSADSGALATSAAATVPIDARLQPATNTTTATHWASRLRNIELLEVMRSAIRGGERMPHPGDRPPAAASQRRSPTAPTI